MEVGEYFISVDDHFFQQPLLVWSTNFFSQKKSLIFSRQSSYVGRGGVGLGVT